MAANDFDSRVARLEEHLVEPSAEDALLDAERLLAQGEPVWAGLALTGAKLIRAVERSLEARERGDEWEEDDDDAC
jgi:hypothetical protein